VRHNSKVFRLEVRSREEVHRYNWVSSAYCCRETPKLEAMLEIGDM